jgi:hypothetical protein
MGKLIPYMMISLGVLPRNLLLPLLFLLLLESFELFFLDSFYLGI